MALIRIQKMTMEIAQWWLKIKKKVKKRLQKLRGIDHLIFIHAKHLEIDFFAKKCLKPLFLHLSASI